MLGGDVVLITGPCLNQTSEIVCKFAGIDVPGMFVSSTAARCVSPAVFEVGRRLLSMSTNGGQSFGFNGIFTYSTCQPVFEFPEGRLVQAVHLLLPFPLRHTFWGQRKRVSERERACPYSTFLNTPMKFFDESLNGNWYSATHFCNYLKIWTAQTQWQTIFHKTIVFVVFQRVPVISRRDILATKLRKKDTKNINIGIWEVFEQKQNALQCRKSPEFNKTKATNL